MSAVHPTRRPSPSAALYIGACVWISIYLAIVAYLVMRLAKFGTHSFDDLVLWPAGALACLGLAWFHYRAVFTRRQQAAAGMSAIFMLIGLGCGLPLLFIVAQIVHHYDSYSGITLIILLAIAFIIVTAVQLFRWSQRLAIYLKRRPYCDMCGYDLRGSIAADNFICPECGEPIPLEKVAMQPANRDISPHATHPD